MSLKMKKAKTKKVYQVPTMEIISLDNEISLILQSAPKDPWIADSNQERNNPFKLEI